MKNLFTDSWYHSCIHKPSSKRINFSGFALSVGVKTVNRKPLKGGLEMVIGDIIRRNAKRFPKKTALIFEETSYTFKELDDRVNRLANGLLSSVHKKGDRIAIIADNCHQHVEIFCTVAKLGMASMAANPFLSVNDLTYIVRNIETDTVIFQPKYRNIVNSLKREISSLRNFIVLGDPVGNEVNYEKFILAHESKDPDILVHEDDDLLIINTSGTTGFPKQIVHTHKSSLAIALNTLFAHRVTPDDTGIIATPIFWGPVIPLRVLSHFYLGESCIIAAEITPECISKTIERRRANHTMMGTPFLVQLLDHPDIGEHDLSSMRFIALTGTPLSFEILKRAIKVFGSVFSNMYALTECGGIAWLQPDEVVLDGSPKELQRLQSVGREAVNMDVRVVDDQGNNLPPGIPGEVIVRGDAVMKEYLKAPQTTEQTLRNGWLYTGDIATMDNEGYLYIQGRKKDFITISGNTIVASEIEDIIYQEASVKEAAVIGLPDENLGEVVKAFIVLLEGKELTEEEVIELCRKNLPDFAVPRYVEFVSDLPKSAVGKILKYKLRDMYK